MTNKGYRTLIKEVNDYLVLKRPFGAIMIVDSSTDDVKIFDRNDSNAECPYYSAIQYMLMICTKWISSDIHATEDDFTPEGLLWDCIITNDFGDVMGVYIQDEDFNFMRIGY